jgi:hypothetical protein
VVVCWIGPAERASEVVRPFKEFGPPALDFLTQMPKVKRKHDPTNLFHLNQHVRAAAQAVAADACGSGPERA